MSKIDRISIQEKDWGKYEEIREREESPLKGSQNKILYLLALSLGFKYDMKSDELKNKKGFVRLDTLSEKDKALIKVLAIEESDTLEVLDDKAQVYKIADKYATGGVGLLYEGVFSNEPGEYFKKMEEELVGLAEDFSENN